MSEVSQFLSHQGAIGREINAAAGAATPAVEGEVISGVVGVATGQETTATAEANVVSTVEAATTAAVTTAVQNAIPAADKPLVSAIAAAAQTHLAGTKTTSLTNFLSEIASFFKF